MVTLEEKTQLVVANEKEQPALFKLEDVLESFATETTKKAKLVGPDGEEIELPDSLFKLLHQLVYYLAQGKAVSVVPVNKELTTQEAADILNVSRPYFVKLLDQGELPFRKVGSHRRVYFADLMEYKKQYKIKQRVAIDEIAKISQELGYDD